VTFAAPFGRKGSLRGQLDTRCSIKLCLQACAPGCHAYTSKCILVPRGEYPLGDDNNPRYRRVDFEPRHIAVQHTLTWRNLSGYAARRIQFERTWARAAAQPAANNYCCERDVSPTTNSTFLRKGGLLALTGGLQGRWIASSVESAPCWCGLRRRAGHAYPLRAASTCTGSLQTSGRQR
jgi:hypothetical protein